jgi:hypothetical protein
MFFMLESDKELVYVLYDIITPGWTLHDSPIMVDPSYNGNWQMGLKSWKQNTNIKYVNGPWKLGQSCLPCWHENHHVFMD